MPKQSKIRSTRSKPGARESSTTDVVGQYVCTRCGKIYRHQKVNFPASQSPLFAKNGGYLTVCGSCIDKMVASYREILKDDAAVARRICMKFDIYWNEDLFNVVKRSQITGTLIRAYIGKTNLYKYAGKTFDDTIEEEEIRAKEIGIAMAESLDTPVISEDTEVSIDMIDFWGIGYTNEEYKIMQRRYDRWTAQHIRDMGTTEIGIGAETLYRQICKLELTVDKNTFANKPTEPTINQINNLVGSVNAKPIQQRESEADTPFDSLPFGVGIKIFENERPIPKPLPEFEDVDGIAKKISVWFLGHLCKMLHIKNTYCKMYEEEMARLKVERPEVADEDDEDAFNDIFGGDSAS